MPKLKEIKFNKHWGSFAKGYLKLAEQGFLYIKNQAKNDRKFFDKKSKVIYSLENGGMIIASIWNIKHGLELVIKALGVNFNKQYWNEHDLLSLFNDLKIKIVYFSLERDIIMLEKLIEKYHRCEFSKKTIFCDLKNDYLRYPEIENKTIDYSFVHDLKEVDVDHFLKDIYNTKKVYELLEAELQHYQTYWKLSKKEADNILLSVSTMKNPGFKK